MEAKAAAAGFTKYLTTLVVTVLFPLQWMRMIKVARRHQDMDQHAVKKVAAGAIIGLLLASYGAYMVVDFESNATAGAYSTMDGRLSFALGEEQYKSHVSTAEAAQGRVELAERKLSEGEDPELWNKNREDAIAERDSEQAKADALLGNHILFGTVHEFVMAQDDAGALATIENRGAIDFPGLDNGAQKAFDKKDQAIADMGTFLTWFVWPGVIGVLFAPLIFALGNVLKQSFVPSETVGYKQYPGASMALFLLLGGFGVPALFFAAWTFQDVEERTQIGQIAL